MIMDNHQETIADSNSMPALARKKCDSLTSALNHCANLGLPNPWKKYTENRSGAKSRGIDWSLTFDEWWSLWLPHYHLRGIGFGKMNLCRTGDVGGYHLHNVRIDTWQANVLEMTETFDAKVRATRQRKAAEKRDKPKRTARLHKDHHWLELSMSLADPLEILLAKEAINAL